MFTKLSRTLAAICISTTTVFVVILLLYTSTALAIPIYVDSAYSSSYPKVIAGNPATGKVYIGRVGSWPTGDIMIIDDRTGNIDATLDMSFLPQAIAVNQTTNRIYVVPWSPGDNMYIINGETSTITDVVASSGSFYRMDVAVSEITNKVYIAGYMWGAGGPNIYLSIFNGSTLAYSPTLDLGSGNSFEPKIAVVTNTNKVYVTGQNAVSVVDGLANAIVSTIPVGLYPKGIVANPETNYLYVINRDSNNVSVINGLSDTVVATLTVGITPTAIALNPVTNKVYVANAGDGSVSIIDGASNTISATVNVSGTPALLDIDTGLNRVYVGTGTHLKTIDGANNMVYEPDLVYQPGHAYYALQDISVMPSHKVYIADRHYYDEYGWWYTLADVDLVASTIEAAPISVPIDGISKSTITVTLKDTLGVPVSGVVVSLTASGGGNTITGSGTRTASNGQMTGQLWSSVPGPKIITGTLPEGKSLMNTIVVTFTSLSAPEVPLLLTPPDGTITTTQSITLIWQASAGATPVGYNVLVNGNIVTTTATTSATIFSLGAYTWTVRAYNETGYSNWAAPQSIIVIGPGTQYATVDPMTGSVITTTDSSGVTTTIQIPAGAVTTTTQLLYTPVLTVSGSPSSTFAFAGHAFSLNAYQNGVHVPLTFTNPITIFIEYTDADVANLNEPTLALYYWNGSQWASDGIAVIERDTGHNRVVVTLRHLSDLALFGQITHRVFLPLVVR